MNNYMKQMMIRFVLASLMVCSLCLSTASAQTAEASIVDASVSAASARDGVTITLGYRIQSQSGTTASLGAVLTGPNGEVVDSTEPATEVSISAGTDWYYRQFLINLPPLAASGSYDVTWQLDGNGWADSMLRQDCIEILPPIPVRCPILYYHKVGPVVYSSNYVQTDMFRQQMQALKAYGYTSVTLQDLMDYRAGLKIPPEKPIVITFDDGYENWYTDAFPILADPAIDYKATYFIATNKMGGTNAWDKDNNPIINMLTWPQIQELHDSGRIDIESHSHNHPNLAYVSANRPWDLPIELGGSKQTIESRLGKSCRFICYPYGLYDSQVQSVARERGYFAGLATVGELDQDCADKWALRRLGISNATVLDFVPSNTHNFLFGPLYLDDPDVPLAKIYLSRIEYLDAATNQPLVNNHVVRGQSIRIRVYAYNTGPTASIKARLRIDTDQDTSNGLIYDSQAMTPSQNIPVNFTYGSKVVEWLWQVPADAPAARYHVLVRFQDEKCVLGYGDIPWQTAFVLLPDVIGSEYLKTVPEGAKFTLRDMVVTAVFPDCFYAEVRNRASGIRVESPDHQLDVGMTADVSGEVKIGPNGECYLSAIAATHAGYGTVRPLGISTASVGGGSLGRQQGVWVTRRRIGETGTYLAPSMHPNNIGLLISTWGRVVSIDTMRRTITLDDGSGAEVKCVLPSDVDPEPGWDYVMVTGISTCERIDGKLLPLVRLRSQSDIKPILTH